MKKILEASVLFFAISFLLAAGSHPAPSPASAPEVKAEETNTDLLVLEIMLRVIKSTEGKITHVEVGLEMPSCDRPQDKAFTLKAYVKNENAFGIADRIENLRVTDDKGAVGLKPLEDQPQDGGRTIMRKWKALRPTSGTVKVSYRSRVPQPKPRTGPPFELYQDGGGMSGAGCGFLALPDECEEFELHLTWDLQCLGPGAAGVSSLGDGNFETTCPIDRIFNSCFMAGPIGRYPEQGRVNGFSSAWLGKPPFDVQEEMAWTAKAFTFLRTFFRDVGAPESYHFFMTAGPESPGVGGAGFYNSFMLFAPVDSQLAGSFRGTIFHEMIHQWIYEMEEASAGASFWFVEGLTDYYTRLLMFRAGFLSADEYLEKVNDTVTAYMTNPLRNLPNDRIYDLFWQDRNAEKLPYDRGSLYFAQVNAEIHQASNGKRSLDDVILPLLGRTANGTKLTRDMWLEALKKELGPAVLTEFESIIIRGEDFIPDPAAFGPEFERVPAKLSRFELGFDAARTFGSPEQRITGLVKGSAAERTGLQNGDQILNAVDLRKLRENKNQRLKLEVRRGQQILEIEYLPSEEPVDGYKWVLIPDVSRDIKSE